MAKEDFCFTYYDGDAARDMAHMNRLERGAYGDLIVSQRKFGRLPLTLIKKTLGNDFNAVWESLEIILKKDEDGKYYIEWVDNSVEKMRRQSKHQSENGKLGGRPKKESQPKPKLNPTKTQTESQEKPLEDGDGDGNGDGLEDKDFGKSENLLIPKMIEAFLILFPKYPKDKNIDFPALREIAEKIQKTEGLKGDVSHNTEHILKRWGEMVVHIKADNHLSKYSISQVNKHFQSVIQSLSNGSANRTSNKSKPGTSEARTNTAKGWGSGFINSPEIRTD